MANNLTSNTTTKIMQVFMKAFEASRVLCKGIDTQVLKGEFTPEFGSTVYVKRPHRYKTISTTDGDISGFAKNAIIAGSAKATVQNYITAATEWKNIEEALQLNQLDKILAPMATQIVTDLELALGQYMMVNCNLSVGTPGTAVDAWADVANAGTLMQVIGVPQDSMWTYACPPGVGQALAALQTGLSPGQGDLVDNAWERAMISKNFAGMRVMTSNALPSRVNTTDADMAGVLTSAPDVTYATAKDTMTQTWAVGSFGATTNIKAGSVIQVTGKYRCSGSTLLPVFDAAGNQILFRGIVTADSLMSAGAGNITVAGAGIYASAGAYNTTTAALSTDVVTILGTAGATYQPSLFFHPQAFGLATVKLPKLYATDTIATTEDGFSLRVTRYADGDANTQKIRFDLLPAFATFNPFFAGHGYGS